MDVKHVKGKEKGSIMLYALSTCVWCGKMKKLLDDLGVAYSYVHVDLLEEGDRTTSMEEIEKWNPKCSFPTLVINNKACIVGFKEQESREAIGA